MISWLLGWIFTIMWIDYTFFKGKVIPVIFFGILGLVALWWTTRKPKEKPSKETKNTIPNFRNFAQEVSTEDYYNTLQELRGNNS